MWVEREVKFAVEEKKFREKIIPLLLVAGNYRRLSWTLSQFQHIDFTGDFWDACTLLLKVWKVKLKKKVRDRFER